MSRVTRIAVVGALALATAPGLTSAASARQLPKLPRALDQRTMKVDITGVLVGDPFPVLRRQRRRLSDLFKNCPWTGGTTQFPQLLDKQGSPSSPAPRSAPGGSGC